MLLQISIGTAEMMVAEKTVIGRQRRRMDRCQHQVTIAVNERPLLLGICPPKDKDQMVAMLRQGPDSRIRKLFPALPLVGTGAMGTHRQGGIEQQHPLFGPTGQIARSRQGSPGIVVNFLEDVLQLRRIRHPVVD